MDNVLELFSTNVEKVFSIKKLSGGLSNDIYLINEKFIWKVFRNLYLINHQNEIEVIKNLDNINLDILKRLKKRHHKKERTCARARRVANGCE